MPKNLIFTKIIATLFLTAALTLTVHYTYADDPCKSITDLDKKAECYEKEIEEREEEYQSTSKKLADVRSKKNGISSKITELSGQLNVTQAELNEVDGDIKELQAVLEEINKNLSDRKDRLSEKIALRNHVIRNYSKRTMMNELELFFGAGMGDTKLSGFQLSYMSHMFNKSVSDEAITLIKALNSEISNFEKDKAEAEKLKNELEDEKNNLVALKAELDNRKANAQGEFNELGEKEDNYAGDLADLEKEINELSEKQQAILQAKSGEFSASLSEGVETDDSRTSPSYNPGFSPAFAAFSYGAYTHRNGMSQYGARGRAEDGQEYEEILKFYYKTEVEEKDDLDDKEICVNDGGNKKDIKMGEYLKGLGEMPPSWHEEALKAQAVAARTYAYRYTKNGNCICTTTNCQYWHKDLMSRSDRQRWYDAIKNTAGIILKGDVSAQYSSTTGGWINNVGWDKDGSWPNDAYEKKGGSPWFFKAWFTQTYKKDSSTCSLKSPWLTGKEMADILNAYVLLKAGKNTERVVPETINKCSISGVSGKPYSKDELRDKAESIDKGFSNVTGVETPKYSDGRTTSITFQTDQGSYTVDGQLFMKAFNVRAPGYIAIKYSPDTKALYSILKK